MKILIIGADGQLGTDLCKIIPAAEQIPLTIKDLDISDRKKTLEMIGRCQAQVVINTAAYNRVDEAEDKPEQAFAINIVGVRNLAEACRENDSILVSYSSDYVFDGQKKAPYTESDRPHPRSLYGISKLGGEMVLEYMLKKYFIIRSCGLYGTAGCMGKGGGNFVENIIQLARQQSELKVVRDEIVSPTYARDLAGKTYELIQTKNYRLYHVVNHGECSWFDFAREVFALMGQSIKIHPVASDQLKSKAIRPKFSVLANSRLAELGLDDLQSWESALRAYMLEKGYITGGRG